MTPPLRLHGVSLLLLVVCAGCAYQTYSPKPLDPERLAATYATRSTGETGLKAYMLAHGVSESAWPVARWGLKELTLLSFYFHPDLMVARAQAAAARIAVAKSRPSWGISPRVEHHSDRPSNENTPWSLGFELDIPVFGGSRGAVLVEREQIAAESAELHVGYTAWQVRVRVRDALLGLYSARRNLDFFEKEALENDALLKLLQRRLQEGMASTGEVTTARLRATQARGEVEAQKLAAERLLGVLSGALGVPLEITRALALSFTDFDTFPTSPDAASVRAQALLNRTDLRQQLLSYAATESAIKLEVARQYPEVRLSPGYFWDQSDSVWSLALGFLFPGALGNAPAIKHAMAKREVAAKEFERLQARVLAESESGAAVYRQSLEGLAAVESQTALVQKRLAETQALFAGGVADRVALVQGKLETLIAARGAWVARQAALTALGELENATQVPLGGGPLPRAYESNPEK